jgi:hypothetical protein
MFFVVTQLDTTTNTACRLYKDPTYVNCFKAATKKKPSMFETTACLNGDPNRVERLVASMSAGAIVRDHNGDAISRADWSKHAVSAAVYAVEYLATLNTDSMVPAVPVELVPFFCPISTETGKTLEGSAQHPLYMDIAAQDLSNLQADHCICGSAGVPQVFNLDCTTLSDPGIYGVREVNDTFKEAIKKNMRRHSTATIAPTILNVPANECSHIDDFNEARLYGPVESNTDGVLEQYTLLTIGKLLSSPFPVLVFCNDALC